MSKFLKIAGIAALICLPAVLYATFSTPPGPFPAKRVSKHVSAEAIAVESVGPRGCWEVAVEPGDTSLVLNAAWHQICPEGVLRSTMGESELPTTTFFIDSWVSDAPDMAQAHRHAELSASLSFSEDYEAGLLYLPMTSSGHGVFVAAWVGEPGAGAVSRGMKLGHYGARPPSVETSVGRVFLSPPPDTILELGSASELVRSDEPDQEEAGER